MAPAVEPDGLWPLVADTNRFNRDAGVPEVELGGSTVNLAARLVDLSSGLDVVVSSAVACDPEVADLLGSELNAEPIEATLKGFEDERFEIWSVG